MTPHSGDPMAAVAMATWPQLDPAPDSSLAGPRMLGAGFGISAGTESSRTDVINDV